MDLDQALCYLSQLLPDADYPECTDNVTGSKYNLEFYLVDTSHCINVEKLGCDCKVSGKWAGKKCWGSAKVVHMYALGSTCIATKL